jgi:hypothetical protein
MYFQLEGLDREATHSGPMIVNQNLSLAPLLVYLLSIRLLHGGQPVAGKAYCDNDTLS